MNQTFFFFFQLFLVSFVQLKLAFAFCKNWYGKSTLEDQMEMESIEIDVKVEPLKLIFSKTYEVKVQVNAL